MWLTNSQIAYHCIIDGRRGICKISTMDSTMKTDAVRFTTKGQVVIPAWLRKEFDIQVGTRAVVQATPEGILLKPVTASFIKRGRGILKRRSGQRPLTEEWTEHKQRERDLEERHAR